ncbi:MAG TPA: SDR family NAD(P)-dependent oxidoreductase [Steroidobacter sp.]|jgi:NAD(P)-dependent dehydrogenase (short-subunit alcohol dehydrogenase family)|nr:SDR family NAD(P)-dependent oxidoreductase [Steroidobacteraceae bacterium]HLS81008.1 SDR family NAD(P)-dependent oxidoreductase [Steroidobacter sp.]
MSRFNGKTAIVTGAASGIGRAVAERLVREGARVVLGDINAAGLSEVKAELGAAASAHELDVANHEHCAAIVRSAIETTGRLDILCNIAGVLNMAPIAAITPDEWNRIIQINLSGVFYMCQAALPRLVETKGCIVNLSSAAGLVGVPFNAPYVASKHGVVGLTRALALEFANAGVRINAICPTGVKTPMIMKPLAEGLDAALLAKAAPWLDGGEFCDPSDIADAVAFLASNEAKRITGIALPVDGGQTAF